MLGVSRWSESGGSYRTIQRFLNTKIAWGKGHLPIIRRHWLDADEALLVATDEVVVTNSSENPWSGSVLLIALWLSGEERPEG